MDISVRLSLWPCFLGGMYLRMLRSSHRDSLGGDHLAVSKAGLSKDLVLFHFSFLRPETLATSASTTSYLVWARLSPDPSSLAKDSWTSEVSWEAL